jgi:hypothetical protein
MRVWQSQFFAVQPDHPEMPEVFEAVWKTCAEFHKCIEKKGYVERGG